MKKSEGFLHHQVVSDCPYCGEENIEDLGECCDFEGDEVQCQACGECYELITRC